MTLCIDKSVTETDWHVNLFNHRFQYMKVKQVTLGDRHIIQCHIVRSALHGSFALPKNALPSNWHCTDLPS